MAIPSITQALNQIYAFGKLNNFAGNRMLIHMKGGGSFEFDLSEDKFTGINLNTTILITRPKSVFVAEIAQIEAVELRE